MEYRPTDIRSTTTGGIEFECVWCGRTLRAERGSPNDTTLIHLLHHSMKLAHVGTFGLEKR